MKKIAVASFQRLKDVDIRIKARKNDEIDESKQRDSLSDGAVVTILMLFYQIASLIKVDVKRIEISYDDEILKVDHDSPSLSKSLLSF